MRGILLTLYRYVHWGYKMIHWGMYVPGQMSTCLGYPMWFAWSDVTLEVIAVVCLVLGLYFRTTSLALLLVLVPALEIWIPNGL